MAKAVDLFKFLALVLAQGSMIVLVVIFGDVFPNYAYAFAVALSMWGTIFFYLIFVIYYRRFNPFLPLQTPHRKEVQQILLKQSIINGFAWSMNYVMALLANPKVSGLYQVVLSETSLIMICLASLTLLGNRYHLGQWLCFGAVMVGGILPIFGGGDDDSAGKDQPWWLLIFMLGAWAVGIANILTENVMRNVHCFTGPDNTEKLQLISSSQFLCLSQLFSVMFVFALIWVPIAAQGSMWSTHFLDGMGCLCAGRCPASQTGEKYLGYEGLAVFAMWSSSTCSLVSALIAAAIQRKQDVVYVTVAYTLGPVVSFVILMLKFLMGDFYQAPTLIKVVANILTLGGGVLYKVLTSLYTAKPSQDSWLTAKFKILPFNQCLLGAVEQGSMKSGQGSMKSGGNSWGGGD